MHAANLSSDVPDVALEVVVEAVEPMFATIGEVDPLPHAAALSGTTSRRASQPVPRRLRRLVLVTRPAGAGDIRLLLVMRVSVMTSL
jgi:hypothetical protein